MPPRGTLARMRSSPISLTGTTPRSVRVDTETERRIQKGIEAVLEGRISLIIAHRLSTIRAADRILFIDRGLVIEEENHAALLARQGAYAELYSRQFHRDAETTALGSAAQTRRTE